MGKVFHLGIQVYVPLVSDPKAILTHLSVSDLFCRYTKPVIQEYTNVNNVEIHKMNIAQVCKIINGEMHKTNN